MTKLIADYLAGKITTRTFVLELVRRGWDAGTALQVAEAMKPR